MTEEKKIKKISARANNFKKVSINLIMTIIDMAKKNNKHMYITFVQKCF